jgi:hypothetical protein
MASLLAFLIRYGLELPGSAVDRYDALCHVVQVH